jgi:hypothetical protein
MFTKFLTVCAKHSDDVRSYANVVHLERKKILGRQVATFTNGYFVACHYERITTDDPDTVMLLPVGDVSPIAVNDYPKISSVIGGDPDRTPNHDDSHITAGQKIMTALGQAKITAKTYINPKTGEVSHDGEKPGTIRADWLASYAKLGRYMVYHGDIGDDLHWFTITGNKGQAISFFCVAIVDKK